jgi:hypothetical protein
MRLPDRVVRHAYDRDQKADRNAKQQREECYEQRILQTGQPKLVPVAVNEYAIKYGYKLLNQNTVTLHPSLLPNIRNATRCY